MPTTTKIWQRAFIGVFGFLLMVACAFAAPVAALVLCAPRVDMTLSRAKLDIKCLDQAVTAYYLRHRKYPEDLDALFRPDAAGAALLKDRSFLMDPWGKPYVYEPMRLHPQTEKPLIYSEGPPGQGIRIRNWD